MATAEGREKAAAWQRQYRKDHPERFKKSDEQRRRQSESAKRRRSEAKKDPVKVERQRQQARARYYRIRDTEIFQKRRSEYARRRKANNPLVRLLLGLRRRLVLAIRGHAKSAGTMKLVGCTPAELKAHIENQFQPGMTWQNYGKKGWTIDHRKPCARFDLSIPEEQAKCFHYSNLQPMWAGENSSKKDRYIETLNDGDMLPDCLAHFTGIE